MRERLPTYDVRNRAEGGWTGVAAASGALAGAICGALDFDPAVSGAVAGLTAAVVRWALGLFVLRHS